LDEFYQPNADYSLSAIAMVLNERLCTGCGDCVAVCRTMSKGLAINVRRGKIHVKPELSKISWSASKVVEQLQYPNF